MQMNHDNVIEQPGMTSHFKFDNPTANQTNNLKYVALPLN